MGRSRGGHLRGGPSLGDEAVAFWPISLSYAVLGAGIRAELEYYN
jgi:hypothetical protein